MWNKLEEQKPKRTLSSMPIRAGLLTLKMTPSFIRAHGTGLRA
jgi:hypothetical protein